MQRPVEAIIELNRAVRRPYRAFAQASAASAQANAGNWAGEAGQGGCARAGGRLADLDRSASAPWNYGRECPVGKNGMTLIANGPPAGTPLPGSMPSAWGWVPPGNIRQMPSGNTDVLARAD